MDEGRRISLDILTYGAYQFPHNPRKIEYLHRFRLAAQQQPGHGTLYQAIGSGGKMVRCEGELFGQTAVLAMQQLSALASACSGMEAKTLKLPTGETFLALPSQFGYTAQGNGQILSYRVEFMEVNAANGNHSTV